MKIFFFFFSFKNILKKGIDEGGLTLEWINLTLREILDPNKGLFVTSSNGVTLQPSRTSFLVPNHLLYFKYVGRLIAKSLVSKLNVEIDFTRSFLKHILSKNQ